MQLLKQFIFGLVLLGAINAEAQVKLTIAADYVKDPAINDARNQELIALTEKTINAYVEGGRVFDEAERRVTNDAIKGFNELFTPSAEVVKDYVEFPPRELIDFKDYSIEVYNLLSDKGVQFKITKAELKEIKVRTLGSSTFYVPVVKLNKTLYSYIDRYGALKQSASGKSIELLMSFDIYSEDMSSASISKIEHGVSVKPADDYNRLISIYALGGISSYSPTYSSYWDDNYASNTFDVTSGINWGLGVDFMTDQFITSKSNSDRKIGWSAGVRFTSLTIDADIPEFATSQVEEQVSLAETDQSALRFVSTGNVAQTTTLSTFSIPIGVDYKFIKSRTMIFAVHGRVVPSFALSANATTSGTFLHDVYFPEYDLLFSDPTSGSANWGSDVDAGSRTFELESNPELQSFVLGIEISPTAYFNFEDTDSGWGIMVGADIGFVPGSFFAHDPIESISGESVALSSDINPLLTSYLSDMSSMQFAIRVGLFHRNVTQP